MLQQSPHPSLAKSHESALSNGAEAASLLTHPDFVKALQQEAFRRSFGMIEGVQAFQAFQEQQQPAEPTPHRILWRKANAALLDYGGSADAPAILCVPSLINKHYILDLYPERSLVRALKDAGFRVCMLNWSDPGVRERRYDCADYVSHLLLDAIDALRLQHRGALYLLGYCMGGILALAAAQLRPSAVQGLILLATPWDFSGAPPASAPSWERFEQHIMRQDTVPPLWTETLFHLLDPWHFQEKFRRFSDLSHEQQQHFTHVERWANDGVPLSRYVARECYIRWPRDNILLNGTWKVAGQAIVPQRTSCPALVVTPSKDRIVPLASSAPLAALLPSAQQLKPPAGHVGMVVGSKAPAQLYEPLCGWLNAQI